MTLHVGTHTSETLEYFTNTGELGALKTMNESHVHRAERETGFAH